MNHLNYQRWLSNRFGLNALKIALVGMAFAGAHSAYAACGTAHSVSFYGTIDASVQATNSGGATGGTTGRVSSGDSTGSNLGVKGRCTLQEGVVGIFDLEAGLAVNNGTFKNYRGDPTTIQPTLLNGSTTTGFNSRSFVGLQTPLGTLTIGRDYAPIFYAAHGSDVMGLGFFGNLQETVPIVGGTDQWARLSNAVFYQTPVIHRFVGRVAYSFGSQSTGATGAPPAQADHFLGLGGSFQEGNLLLNASWQQLKVPDVVKGAYTGDVSNRRDWLVGGTYHYGLAEIAGGHWAINYPARSTANWVGVAYSLLGGKVMGEAISLKTDVSGGQNKSGTSLGLAYMHSLGNGASWYATYGQVSNSANSAYALVTGDSAVAPGGLGATPKGFALGYRIDFN